MSETPPDDQNDKRERRDGEGAGGQRRQGGTGGSRDRRDDRGARPSGDRAGGDRGGRDRDAGGRPSTGRPSGGRPSGDRGAGRPSAAGGDRRGGYSRDGQGRDGQSSSGRGGYSRDGQGSGGRGSGSRDGQSAGGRGGYSRDGQTPGGRGGYSRDGQGAGGRGGAPSRNGQGAGGRSGEARRPDGQRPSGQRPNGQRPSGQRPNGQRPSGERSNDQRGGQRPGGRGGRDEKLWTREGRPARGDRDARDFERELTEEERMARELRSVRTRHDDPEIPDGIEPRDLDKGARTELKTLSKENAEWVARHLVMAARLIEEDPELAHQHAMSAARRAGRIGVVRETLAITAYATGDFALALRELRTYRRISGSNDQLPLMVDSERGVGRADRALELGRSVDRTTLPNDVQASLAIAMSGARLDLGQPEAALAELEIPQLDPNRAFSWSPDLFHAYADVLEELGRDEQAATWRERATRAEEAIGAALSVDEHETVDIVEEEFEGVDIDDDEVDSFAIVEAGDSDLDADAVIELEDPMPVDETHGADDDDEEDQDDDDKGDDGTVPTER